MRGKRGEPGREGTSPVNFAQVQKESISLTSPVERRVFGTLEVERYNDRLLIRENALLVPWRFAGIAVVGTVSFFGACSFFAFAAHQEPEISFAFRIVSAVCLFVLALAVVAWAELSYRRRHPLVLEVAPRTLRRGRKMYMRGEFSAEVERCSDGQTVPTYKVRLVQPGRKVLLLRTESPPEAKELADFINDCTRT